MQCKGKAPTASQKRWMEAVRGIGSVVTLGAPAVVHHAVGRTGKHNKVPIGHEWLIPLTDEEHKAMHLGETFGFEDRKSFEKAKFDLVFETLIDHPDRPDLSVYYAIMDYHL